MFASLKQSLEWFAKKMAGKASDGWFTLHAAQPSGCPLARHLTSSSLVFNVQETQGNPTCTDDLFLIYYILTAIFLILVSDLKPGDK